MANETVRLAQYAAALRYEDIPAEIIGRAKECIADTVAAIICGAALPWSRIVIAYAERTGPGGKCRILGTSGPPVTAPAAALANGALAHAFELDSLTRPGAGVHPGATLLPPALAIAQQQGLGGRRSDRCLCRRLRGHGADRPRHRPYQRTARLSRARQYRTVWRRGRRRASVAARPRADGERPRHRRFARLGIARIRPRRQGRHGQTAASRPRLGRRRIGGEPRA